MRWDVFISHASEDKASVARPLAQKLEALGLEVWFDETQVRVGDSLRAKIDEGLAQSRFGVVILSPAFLLNKKWSQRELAGLFARGVDVVLPVWHEVSVTDVEGSSPMLADVVAVSTSQGISAAAEKIAERAAPYLSTRRQLPHPYTTQIGSSERIEVQFANPSDLERHRAFFAAKAREEPMIPPRPAPAADAESWSVDEAWDASHKVPERGDGKKVNPPALVAWSPKGDLLVTAADAWGLTTWSVSGRRRVGQNVDPASYGYPLRCFVAQRGGAFRVLQETSSNLHRYYLIHNGEADMIVSAVNDLEWGFSFTAPGPPASWDGNASFDPWRPGSVFELAFVDNFNTLKVVNVSDLKPESALPQSSRSKSWFSTLFDRSGSSSNQKSPRSRLHEVAPVCWLDFGSLGARYSTIFRFLWHPSGEYIAVCTGDWDDRHNLQVHVVHVRSGQIVGSIPATTTCLTWSPGGRYLLVKRWIQSPASRSGDGRRVPEAGVWDAALFNTLFGELEEILSQPWALHGLFSAPKTPDGTWGRSRNTALSADGRRMLIKEGTVITSVQRDGCSIHPGEELARISPQAFTYAAWSPTDPYCFATVGGEDSKEHPETYEQWTPEPQHGNLLRIWRGIGD